MGLKKLAAKVAEYNDRLERGKARKIKPDHVRKVLHKLREKEAELVAELAEVDDPEKIKRLNHKISIAREHLSRAEWLLDEIGDNEAPAPPD
ncbi:MAG: hypothetical protein EX258_08220 [Sphingomonadaceae bacterium]|nr:hypothetical protein [Paracoccaceae bacterium]RZV49026.1 MAG: hypothetical protein EX258_08220 [Sphingomonadaceae bacterium]